MTDISRNLSSFPFIVHNVLHGDRTPVVVQNLLSQINGKSLIAKYDGYTCCPLITGYHSGIMAEFDYDGNLALSLPLDPTKEGYSMFLAKVYALPWIYWHQMLKGKSFEADIFKPINQLTKLLIG